MEIETIRWSRDTFGLAELGDERRLRRLIQMGARAAETPDGRLSETFGSVKEREGAYDFVENESVEVKALGRAVFESTARAAAQFPLVLVPLDGTSLKLWDGTGRKDFGAIGSRINKATGLKVMNGLALSPLGVPIGLAAQSWWRRPHQRVKKQHHSLVPIQQKETQHWLHAVQHVEDAFAKYAPRTKVWFQLDRGADGWSVLLDLARRQHLFTVRSSVDRRLTDARGSKPRFLRKTLKKQPVLFNYSLDIRERVGHKKLPDRQARTANLAVRVSTVTLKLRDRRNEHAHPIQVNVVMLRESRTVPKTEKPLAWFLLTNHPVSTQEEVERVIFGYVQRWRIEEFHKAWKTGYCNVERTQLHTSNAVIRWATILATVAVRVERLKFLSRSTPDEPAITELSESELAALRLLRIEYGPTNEKQPKTLTLGVATRWIADLGGYTGKSSGGPPGSITIRRGLERLQPAAKVLELLKRPPK